MAALKNAFLYAVRCLAQEKYSKPSVAYEHATGLTGISSFYHFPGGASPDAYERWATSFCSYRNGNGPGEYKRLSRAWGELVALNPGLGIIRPECAEGFRCGIFGAASLYNPDDINFFINVQKKTGARRIALLTHQDPAYAFLEDAIESRTGCRTQWVAAPQTLISIFEKVKNRPVIAEPEPHFYITHDDRAELTPEQIRQVRELINLADYPIAPPDAPGPNITPNIT